LEAFFFTPGEIFDNLLRVHNSLSIIGWRTFPFERLELDSGACPGLDPGFAGETNMRKAWFFVVIPAEAGIQDDLKKKMKSSLDNYGLISKRR
jgi:hypothetical protein